MYKHRPKFLFAFFITLIAVTFMSPNLLAKDAGLSGFNAQLFRPQTDGYGLYNVGASKVLPHLKFSVGLYSNFSGKSVAAFMPARSSSIDLVDKNVSTDFVAAVGLFNFMEAGVGIPAALYQTGSDYNDLQKYRTTQVGDVRADLKFRLLADKPKMFGIGAQSRLTFPTGSQTAFTGNKGVTWEGRLIADKAFKPVSIYGNLGYRIAKNVKVLSNSFGSVMTFGAGLNVPLPIGNRSWSFLAEASGETRIQDAKEVTTPIEFLGGIRKKFDSGISFNFGGGGGATNASGSPNYRAFAGVSFNSAERKSKPSIKAEEKLSIKYAAHFAFDRYRAGKEERPRIEEIGRVLAVNREIKVRVEGHADNIGGKRYNLNLSRRRAEAVKKILMAEGVLEDQISISYFGDTKPAESNRSAKGRAANRRVEIFTE